MRENVRCHSCQQVWDYEPPMGRSEECPKCRNSARVCLNCRFYDKNSYRECRESQAEYVQDKAQANFCGYFSPNSSASSGTSEADLAKSKLNNLFGGKSTAPSQSAGSLADQLQQFLKNKK
jgi:hypothetical protein